jgi:hypothetical protein
MRVRARFIMTAEMSGRRIAGTPNKTLAAMKAANAIAKAIDPSASLDPQAANIRPVGNVQAQYPFPM